MYNDSKHRNYEYDYDYDYEILYLCSGIELLS